MNTVLTTLPAVSLAIASKTTVVATRKAFIDSESIVSDNATFGFAVGFSRQQLLPSNRFANVTNADEPGITATAASICHSLELAKLRPETLEAFLAEQNPTANVFSPRAGNGVSARQRTGVNAAPP